MISSSHLAQLLSHCLLSKASSSAKENLKQQYNQEGLSLLLAAERLRGAVEQSAVGEAVGLQQQLKAEEALTAFQS